MQRKPKQAFLALLLSSAFVVLSPLAWGEDGKTLRKTIRSEPEAKRVKLYGIEWLKSVDSGLAAAVTARPAKPVFVLRTLGDLAGLT